MPDCTRCAPAFVCGATWMLRPRARKPAAITASPAMPATLPAIAAAGETKSAAPGFQRRIAAKTKSSKNCVATYIRLVRSDGGAAIPFIRCLAILLDEPLLLEELREHREAQRRVGELEELLLHV